MTPLGKVNASTAEPFALQLQLTNEQLEQLALRVAEILDDRRDDGFLDTAGAAGYLSLSKTAVYHLVERGKLPHHRAGGRLLFDRSQLRHWVEQTAVNDRTCTLAKAANESNVVVQVSN